MTLTLKDLQRIAESIVPMLREELDGLIGDAVRRASAAFSQAASAPMAILVADGLPRELHGLNPAPAMLSSLIEKLSQSVAAVVRMTCLPQIRIELAREVDTPQMTPESFKLAAEEQLRKYANQFFFDPVREELSRQGKYGEFIARAVFQIINVNVLVDVVFRVLGRLV